MRKTLFIVLTLIGSMSYADPASLPTILNETGVSGGVLVYVGCEDEAFAASLGMDHSFVVQGLTENPAVLAAAREQVMSAERYGPVSIAQFDGRNLPYVDGMVNLLLISKPGKLTRDEITRVLAPKGLALLKNNVQIPGLKTRSLKTMDGWTIYEKPWPEAMDEWTHYLHDSCGTSLSNDLIAGQPKGLRWTCGPFWARSHEHTASMNAMVSAGGKIFYVMDEGSTESIQLPAENYLTARDAFNGVEFWKRPLPNWHNHLYPLKSGPGWLPRRLVAIDDKVYIAPGTGEDLLCLDAATGKILRQYENTASTFELIVSSGVIFAAVNPAEEPCDYKQENANCWKERDRANLRWGWHRENGTRVVKALNAETGETIWKREMPTAPMTLSADAKRVCLYDGDSIYAFDRETGDELWRTDVLDTPRILTGYAGPRLILCEKQIVFAPQKEIFVLDAETGNIIWNAKNKPLSGHYSLEDFYVIGDKIWAMGRANKGVFTTYDLADGTILNEYSNPIDSFYIHQRCFPGKATKRYLLPPIMGMTIYDIEKDEWAINNWVRGCCVYGAMPANGMIYAGPNACACYYQSKLNGFNAIAPDPQSNVAPPVDTRLIKGPAYGKRNQQTEYSTSEWPVFRHDNTRSGYVKTDIGYKIAPAWDKKFKTKLSQAVTANGKVFLSAIDEHTIYALDAASGEVVWRFIAGGRVNSPPALYKGMALFGCADGCVYAVNASDGRLAWKYQAAPNSRQLISFDQLESVWPIAGSVLIQDEKLYCVAGRSMFLDGGLRMVVLNPETGETLYENVMDDKVPDSDDSLQDLLMGKHMPVAMPDILSSDGEYIYMKSQTFTKDGKRLRIQPQRPDTQYDEEVHLFSPISFLDDAWHQRTYWIYGRAAGEGWAEFQLPPKRVPYGRILCLDENNAYSYARDPELLCNTSVTEYRFYSAGKRPKRKVGIPNLEGTRWPKGKYPTEEKDLLAPNTVDWKALAKQPMSKLTALDYNWIDEEPEIQVKAMVMANDLLFIAGPRDLADEKKLWGLSNEETYQEKMHKQAEWLQGKYGSIMQVVSKKDGAKLASYSLDCMPAFDGLIASDGKLYMTTMDGSLICYAPEES